MNEEQIIGLLSSNIIYLLAAALVIIVILKGIKIVPQSEKFVVERFGRPAFRLRPWHQLYRAIP